MDREIIQIIEFMMISTNEKVYMSGEALEMTVGESARVYPWSNSRFAASWTISDPAIATVDHEEGDIIG